VCGLIGVGLDITGRVGTGGGGEAVRLKSREPGYISINACEEIEGNCGNDNGADILLLLRVANPPGFLELDSSLAVLVESSSLSLLLASSSTFLRLSSALNCSWAVRRSIDLPAPVFPLSAAVTVRILSTR
jgi:hypothetical protein